MPWNATLSLDYSLQDTKTVARFRHDGPLRILQSLYPEGPGTCHNVLVHPPGGLVGGDTLTIEISAGTGSRGLITTPGATRFYRSLGESAVQRTSIRLATGARMEWLPMEALCYSGCLAENHLTLDLAADSEMMGWDVTALGLPAAGQPFEQGSFCQRIEMPGIWLEHARLRAADELLLNSPLGLAGQRCIATLFFAAGTGLDRQRRELALDVARQVLSAHALKTTAGATSPHARVVMVRVLAPLVEPAMDLLKQVWHVWRRELWNETAPPPRIWST